MVTYQRPFLSIPGIFWSDNLIHWRMLCLHSLEKLQSLGLQNTSNSMRKVSKKLHLDLSELFQSLSESLLSLFWVSSESLSLIETHLKKSINIQSFKTNILTHPFAFPIDFYVYFAKQHIVCKTNETFILMVIMGPALCCLKRNMALLKVLGHQLMLLRCDHHQVEAFFNLHHDKF